MNPNGNDPKFPKKEDGSRDLDLDRKIADTWKDLEALVEKGLVKAIGVSKCVSVPSAFSRPSGGASAFALTFLSERD